MGNLIAKLWGSLHPNKETRIVMVGLDGAGKTTIFYKIKIGEVVLGEVIKTVPAIVLDPGKTLYETKIGEVIHTGPTIGLNVETVQFKNISFTTWDVGGQEKIRSLSRHYYHNTDAVIFVIDANDIESISSSTAGTDSAEEELSNLLVEEELRGAAILLYANKQDLPNAMTPQQIADRLGLMRIRDRAWHIQGCSAQTGDGIYEGMDWLRETLLKQKH